MQLVFETLLDRLSLSVDEVDFHNALASAAGAFDIPAFAYLSLVSDRVTKPRLISNYHSGWTSHYLRRQYEKIDPVIEWARCSECPFQWGPGFGHAGISTRQQQLFDEAAEFGICCGLTIPLVDRRGGVAAMTFAADRLDPTFLRTAEQYEQALEIMAMCFHISVRRKLSGGLAVDGVLLTPREYECLQWTARGKSAWEIGCILGIKERTAAFHLDNAKKKLGVRTKTQAVTLLASSRSSIL
ncbi:autoinducer binding domain-containing protein [Mesorhizobium captivum]|uniref:autoinducer binding domain-containing protein n=1 Tax=Mesorhizobium captivum TaxID=3072319 RepID=UPI002A23C195|nr:autoinducer binding domain-containing protein [Mesorhizobium sp. VK3C]MDX8449871.1 autoinducer binding domain-containing protein [Mesorhizobium sp. VK3C]